MGKRILGIIAVVLLAYAAYELLVAPRIRRVKRAATVAAQASAQVAVLPEPDPGRYRVQGNAAWSGGSPLAEGRADRGGKWSVRRRRRGDGLVEITVVLPPPPRALSGLLTVLRGPDEPGQPPPRRFLGVAWRLPRRALAVAAALLVLWFLGTAFDTLAATTVRITGSGLQGQITVGGESHAVVWAYLPLSVTVSPPTPLARDWGLDGSESLTEVSLDTTYLASLEATPYGAFDAWLRDEAGYMRWRDLAVSGKVHGRDTAATALSPGSVTPLPPEFTLTAAINRLDQVVLIDLVGITGTNRIGFDRTGRNITLLDMTPRTTTQRATWYFPTNPWPYLALTLHTLTQSLFWAVVLIALVSLVTRLLPQRMAAGAGWLYRAIGGGSGRLAILAVGASLAFTTYITLANYKGMPHIVDTMAYMFQARQLLAGEFSSKIPLAGAFPYPFFGIVGGRWVGQYGPGNPLVIALGLLIHLPWATGLLCAVGTVALVGLIARRLYGNRVALVAVALGAISPFYSFIAGSYMSHPPAAFFATLSYYLLLVSRWGERKLLVALAGTAIGMTFLCRELSGLVLGLVLTAALLLAHWRIRPLLRHGLPVLLWLLGLAVPVGFYGLYDWRLTGDPLTMPRRIINASDQYGFGPGHGWWGQHSVAAGLVNLDQQLTGLLIDLFGWPYYMAFALPLILFVGRRWTRYDFLHLCLAGGIILSTAGYFYHGIVYGPRYTYEAFPFLLLLAARGAQVLAQKAAGYASRFGRPTGAAGAVVAVLLVLFTVPDLTIVLPRQLTVLYNNFNGIHPLMAVNSDPIYRAAPQRALVATPDGGLYGNTLLAMNDPRDMDDPRHISSTLWLFGTGPVDYNRYLQAYPHRPMYVLTNDNGVYHYRPWPPSSSLRPDAAVAPQQRQVVRGLRAVGSRGLRPDAAAPPARRSSPRRA